MLLLADIAGNVERWQGIFAGGPERALTAIIALLVIACGVLFVELMRAKNRSLAYGERLATLTERLSERLRQNEQTLKRAAGLMETSAVRFDTVRKEITGEWPAVESPKGKKETPP